MKRRGFGLVEMLIGAAVLATSLLGISTFYQSALGASHTTTSVVQAGFLLEEGIEAVKLLRDTSWNLYLKNLTPGASYRLAFTGTTWSTTTATTLTDGVFDRTFMLEDVYRDTNDDITTSGGTLDAGTKKLTVSVAWWAGTATTTKTLVTYITNIFGN